MQLLTIPGHTSTAAHIALHWSGVPFRSVIVDSATLRSMPYRLINPDGVVPALIHDDLCLTQTIAILSYVDGIAPSARLFGNGDTRQRAQAMKWLAFLASDVHPAFGPLFAPGVFLQEADAAARLRGAAVARIREQLARIDAHLASNAWLASSRTCADAYLLVVAMWARMFDVDIRGLAHLARLVERLQQDPGVRAALEDEALGRFLSGGLVTDPC